MTSVTVTVPLTIRRRGGRKQIVGPDGAQVQGGEGGGHDVAFTRGDPALVKALARGFRWRRMLEEGRYASIRELAAAEGVDRAYVGRVLNLTLLAPTVVEGLLAGGSCGAPKVSPLSVTPPQRWTEQSEWVGDVELSLRRAAMAPKSHRLTTGPASYRRRQ